MINSKSLLLRIYSKPTLNHSKNYIRKLKSEIIYSLWLTIWWKILRFKRRKSFLQFPSAWWIWARSNKPNKIFKGNKIRNLADLMVWRLISMIGLSKIFTDCGKKIQSIETSTRNLMVSRACLNPNWVSFLLIWADLQLIQKLMIKIPKCS